MPEGGKNGAGAGGVAPGLTLMAIVLLTGCMGRDVPSMLRTGDDATPFSVAGGALAPQAEVQSALIADLQARRSVLPIGGAYAKVADAVVAASAGAAAAELLVARLKAEARAKNWLPSIGPSVNLTALSGLAASLLLEQALFDNGRRKAEREFAAADVEVAAVNLSSAINQRVFEGLTYYVNAERARAQARISSNAAGRLQEFETIMGKRVAGGISDRSEQRVISQRYAEMQATVAADRETEATAMAELAALAGGLVPGLTGLDTLPKSAITEPLSVLRARGEGTRAIAQSKLERAGMMPGLSATANVGADGVNPGVRLTGAGLLNPGSGAALEALAQTTDVVDRQTAEASETANRRIVALERQIATLQSRQAQGAEVLRQTEGNLELFTQQYKVGRRTLLELVGQYDAFARLERDQASLRYDVAVLELEIARDRGLLVDGARM